MINYNRVNKMNAKAKNIIAARLAMQSTQRTLQFVYKLPKYDLTYIQSKHFIDNYFAKWDKLKQLHFLEDVAGGCAESLKNTLVNAETNTKEKGK